MTKSYCNERGFTLTETLAGLGIAAIALGLAAPSLEALTSSNRQALSVNQLVTTMHLARSEAVTRNARVTVCASRDGEECDGEWHDGWIAFLDTDADAKHGEQEELLERVDALNDLQLRSAQFEHAFSYASGGRITGAGMTSSTGEFAFCESGAPLAKRVVIVRGTGLPALSDRGRDGESVRCLAT